MPASPDPRQPDAALAWFSSLPGQGIVAAEQDVLPDVVAPLPDLPWLWLGPGVGQPPVRRHRAVALHRAASGWRGDVLCDGALPIASECLGAVLVQHALDADARLQPWLAECARVLAPGGTLWIAALNPWSPFRGHWARTGLHARDPGHWQAALVRAGFVRPAMHLHWMGPRWRSGHGEAGVGALDRLRAAFALSVVKRATSPMRIRPARRLRLAPTRAGLPLAGRAIDPSLRKSR